MCIAEGEHVLVEVREAGNNKCVCVCVCVAEGEHVLVEVREAGNNKCVCECVCVAEEEHVLVEVREAGDIGGVGVVTHVDVERRRRGVGLRGTVAMCESIAL